MAKAKTPAAEPEQEQEVTGEGQGEELAPPADHIDAWDRQIERLERIVGEAEFDGSTLLGDLRDAILEPFKHRPKPWSQMSESEQKDMARSAEAQCRIILKKIVLVMAEEDEISVQATLKGYSVDGETFKLKLNAKGDEETAIQLFKMDGHEVVIMSADAGKFMQQRRDVDIMPDQPGLAFEGDGNPPSDDSDLSESEGPPLANPDGSPPEGLAKGDRYRLINLTTEMVELWEKGDSANIKRSEEAATPEILAAERERIADFD